MSDAWVTSAESRQIWSRHNGYLQGSNFDVALGDFLLLDMNENGQKDTKHTTCGY